ncbi:PdaC/SigV domain-containing protein [Bergeyella cardium]|uniref:PdaC/SigV domain-containing protein n=1 Tax=Bergeyella cardium TaxID=1585976 RepID=UPI000EA06F13|nr:DUF4163 domain-containing protein [Bergeyella cardium]
MRNTFFLFILSVALCSARHRQTHSAKAIHPTSTNESPALNDLKFEIRKISFKSKKRRKSVSATYAWCTSKGKFAQAFNDSARIRVLKTFEIDNLKLSIADAIKELKKAEKRKLTAKERESLPDMEIYLSSTDSISYRSNKIISLRTYYEAYYGGIHGIHSYSYINFKPDGTSYTNEELIKNPKKLNALIEKKIKSRSRPRDLPRESL